MIFNLTSAINKGLEADRVSSLFKCELEPSGKTLFLLIDIGELQKERDPS